jgi:hypothetical protein
MTSTPIAPAPRAHSDAAGIPASRWWLSVATPPEYASPPKRTPGVTAVVRKVPVDIATNVIESLAA